jgi:hypothetical protein
LWWSAIMFFVPFCDILSLCYLRVNEKLPSVCMSKTTQVLPHQTSTHPDTEKKVHTCQCRPGWPFPNFVQGLYPPVYNGG